MELTESAMAGGAGTGSDGVVGSERVNGPELGKVCEVTTAGLSSVPVVETDDDGGTAGVGCGRAGLADRSRLRAGAYCGEASSALRQNSLATVGFLSRSMAIWPNPVYSPASKSP